MAAPPNPAPEITLDEVARLVRMLGMLGSAHDPEVLVAAKFAAKWVREHGTDWNALLTPEPEMAVTGVGTVQDDTSLHQDQIKAVYDRGYADGMKTMAAQIKAQAAFVQSAPAGGSQPYQGFTVHPSPPQPTPAPAPPTPSWGVAGASNPCPPATWKAVAWQLLHNHACGMPGVFRGSREETFVQDILTRGFPSLTTGQETWLRDIAGRSGMTW